MPDYNIWIYYTCTFPITTQQSPLECWNWCNFNSCTHPALTKQSPSVISFHACIFETIWVHIILTKKEHEYLKLFLCVRTRSADEIGEHITPLHRRYDVWLSQPLMAGNSIWINSKTILGHLHCISRFGFRGKALVILRYAFNSFVSSSKQHDSLAACLLRWRIATVATDATLCMT